MLTKKFFKKWTALLFFVATAVTIFSSCGHTTRDESKTKAVAQKIVVSDKIVNILKYVDKDTLVVFDFDNTLVKQVYEFASSRWIHTKVEKLQAKGINKSEAQNRIYKIADLFPRHKNPMEPVEAATRDVFEQLRSRKINIIILTARLFEEAEGTVKQINSVTMSFDGKQIYSDKIDLGDSVGFSSGILFSPRKPKGETLFLFLDKIGFRPKRIVFIDDFMGAVQSVYDKLIERGIPGVCIHYVAINEHKAKFDFSRADDELQHEFIKHGLDMSIYEDAS